MKEQIAGRLIEICIEDGILENSNHPDLLNANFSTCGVDSMSLMFLQALIEEEWGVHVPATYFASRLRNLNSVSMYIDEQIASKNGMSPAASSAA